MKQLYLMTNRTAWILFAAILLLIQSACSPIVEKLIGMRSMREIRPEEYRRLLRRLDANPADAYLIDTNYINTLWADIGKRDTGAVNRHCQPIQALYYGHGQYPEAWFINCYAPGFPNLDWNRGGLFDTFPPRTAVRPDSLLSFDKLKGLMLMPGNQMASPPATGEGQPYTVVFYWNRFLYRQCRRLHRHLKENLSLHPGPVRIIYLNNDRVFTGLERAKDDPKQVP